MKTIVLRNKVKIKHKSKKGITRIKVKLLDYDHYFNMPTTETMLVENFKQNLKNNLLVN